MLVENSSQPPKIFCSFLTDTHVISDVKDTDVIGRKVRFNLFLMTNYYYRVLKQLTVI